MAPEQLSGEEIDQRADVFSAGVIVVEMLTGVRPVVERTPQHVDLPWQIDRDLAVLLRSCLAPVPCDRFASVMELRDALIPMLRASALPA